MAKQSKPTKDARVVRVICLETDKPHADTQSQKGSFGDILHHHLTKAGEEHHPPLGTSPQPPTHPQVTLSWDWLT